MNLKELRKYKGITQEKAAKLANISLRTYKRIESEKGYESTLKYQSVFDIIFNIKNQRKNVEVKRRKVTIIGCGYVGLSSGILLSQKCDVEFVDIDKNVRDEIAGKYGFPVFKDLKEINKFEFVLICLPTNYDKAKKRFDVKAIEDSIKEVISRSNNVLIVIRSTVSVGYTDSLINKYKKNIIFVPEFLREASSLQDAFRPSRIVVGFNKSNRLVEEFVNIYSSCLDNCAPIIRMNTKEAEATKLFSNAYLATRLAFFNEVDSFAINEEIDPNKIIKGICYDPRIGDYYNEPGCGYSGYCLPKDTAAIQAHTKSKLLKGTIESNLNRKEQIAKQIIGISKKYSDNPIVSFYGYNFIKTNGKFRPNAILEIIEILRKYSVNVVVFDDNSSNFDDVISNSTVIIYKEFNEKLSKANHLIKIKR